MCHQVSRPNEFWADFDSLSFTVSLINRILQPILLGYLIRYFGGEFTVTEGYVYAAGVILCSAWYVTQHHPFFFGLQHIGMRSRVAVSSVVYRKVHQTITKTET